VGWELLRGPGLGTLGVPGAAAARAAVAETCFPLPGGGQEGACFVLEPGGLTCARPFGLGDLGEEVALPQSEQRTSRGNGSELMGASSGSCSDGWRGGVDERMPARALELKCNYTDELRGGRRGWEAGRAGGAEL